MGLSKFLKKFRLITGFLKLIYAPNRPSGDYKVSYSALIDLYRRGCFQEDCLSILTQAFYEPNIKLKKFRLITGFLKLIYAPNRPSDGKKGR